MADDQKRAGLDPEELGALADLASAADEEIVERALAIARNVLGMDLAYMTQFTRDDQVYVDVAGENESFGMDKGGAYPLEGSYCQRMVLGQIPKAVRDTTENEELRDLELTKEAGIGSYVGVPITLSDGTLYGTICTASSAASPELADRDVQFMEVLAKIIASQLEQRRLVEENRSLRGRVDALKVEVDQAARREQVDEIAGADWFKDLSDRAEGLRRTAGSGGADGAGG
jgi:GAF domain-containing protein